MLQYLPYGGFKWVDCCKPRQVFIDLIQNTADNSENGYTFEVDLRYPK